MNNTENQEMAKKERRSIRTFGEGGLSLDETSQLLWAAQGVTDDEGHRTSIEELLELSEGEVPIGVILVPVSIAAKCRFGIFGQFISPAEGRPG